MNQPRVVDTKVLNKSNDTTNFSALWNDFLALIKIGIINSNLITTFAGFWLAVHFTGTGGFLLYWKPFLYTMAGSSLIIAGGCVLNNYYDRDIDHLMKRTKARPTVTGTISLQAILGIGISLTLLGLFFLAMVNWSAVLIGFFGWFTYVVLYTMWSKRRYTLNTVIGSFSGAVPPLIGWAAIDPNLDITAWILFLIMFIWQTPHFLALAMKKTEEYRAAGIPMLPVVHGFSITKRQMIVYVSCLLPLPFYLGSLGTFFVVLATILSVGWFVLSLMGLFMKNEIKWATLMFVYSLNYLTILFSSMVIVTLPIPFLS
ncbi:heme o synthase [Bacillaceae bacterium S4-13-58]